MAREFRAVDRDTPMLLPEDLRAWLPGDHLALLVIDVLGGCDWTVLERSYRRGGAGRQAYDPVMLATLLVYAYCEGVRSSRAIERGCVTNVAFRVIAAQQRPDHTTIAKFRQAHGEAFAQLFTQVLGVCAAHGMGRVGVVAIDGTKVAANAAPERSRSAATLRRMVDQIAREADAADAAEDAELGERTGDELPAGLAPGADRRARVKEALRQAEAEQAERVAHDVALAQARVGKARAAETRSRERRSRRRPSQDPDPSTTSGPGESGDGLGPVTVAERREVQRRERAEERLAAAERGEGPFARRNTVRRNTTDPDSRIMKAGRGDGFVQAYNAQVVVSDDHLILDVEIAPSGSDRDQFIPMMRKAQAVVAEVFPDQHIDTVLADAGYSSRTALSAEGPDRLIATGRDPARPGRDPGMATMAARLAKDSPDRATYQRRGATVEPVIGNLKTRIGLRQFSRRGLQAVREELKLAATAYNLHRLANSWA